MSDAVTDTNALIWHLQGGGQLTPAAQSCFTLADAGQIRIFIPTICAVELVYLSEKGRIERSLLSQALALMRTAGGSYRTAPLDDAVVRQIAAVPREDVPDMPDRIVAATALAFGLPLLTSDGRIRSCGVVPVVW